MTYLVSVLSDDRIVSDLLLAVGERLLDVADATVVRVVVALYGVHVHLLPDESLGRATGETAAHFVSSARERAARRRKVASLAHNTPCE